MNLDAKKTAARGTFENSQYIGQKVDVQIDRPVGSNHPIYGFEYLVNYGFIPNTMTEDGKELDAYVLGISVAIKSFSGSVIAMIHRLNDNEDKSGKDWKGRIPCMHLQTSLCPMIEMLSS